MSFHKIGHRFVKKLTKVFIYVVRAVMGGVRVVMGFVRVVLDFVRVVMDFEEFFEVQQKFSKKF